MRITIIAPLHHYEKYRQWGQNADSLFYKTQSHYHYSKCLRALGHQVLEIRNTDWIGVPWIDYILNTNSGAYKLMLEIIQRRVARNMSVIKILKSKRDLNQIDKFKPDVIIISGGEWLATYSDKFFRALRGKMPTRKIVLFNGMSPLYYRITIEKRIIGVFDLVLTNDPVHAIEWRMLGAKRAESLPLSAVPEDGRLFSLKRDIEVSFIGSFYDNRHKIFEYLFNNDIQVKVWGKVLQEIAKDAVFWKFYQGKATMDSADTIYGHSKIVLNIHEKSMPTGGNMRTFEVPVYGALQIVDRCPPAWLNDKEDVVLFSDKSDLLKKIRFYLSNDEAREQIAAAGRKRVLECHTYRCRAIRLLEMIK